GLLCLSISIYYTTLFRSRVTIMASEATPLSKWAFRQAVKAGMKRMEAIEGGKPVPPGTRLAYAFWDFAVLRNLRRMLGFDRLKRSEEHTSELQSRENIVC